MRIILIGSNGQLGTDLARVLEKRAHDLHPIANRKVDICQREAVERLISSVRPDVVINTAAFHQVDRCEANPEMAFAVNAVGVRNVAECCEKHKAVFVHFSTDYVFDGCKGAPYTETDVPSPLNVYGVSKVAGEELVAYTTERNFIVRTCGLFGLAGPSGKGLNFVENMLKRAKEGNPIRVVEDQILSPTYTLNLAERVCDLLQTNAYGLYHLSSEGECSWYEFAREIFQRAGVNADLNPCTTVEVQGTVRRPKRTTLDKAKYNALGLPKMPHWAEGLRRYLGSRA
ncbi:MAG: dTDP-4-dehydrorhamnose reductase [Terriglobia bacterium]|nr:dTDP-4-dehydrorhamnose reductase [Terriglobia bacterium]